MTIAVAMRKVNVTKSIAKQLPVWYYMHNLVRDAADFNAVYGWFYGDVLGKEYRHEPYIMCGTPDGGTVLIPVSHYAIDGTSLNCVGVRDIPHIVF